MKSKGSLNLIREINSSLILEHLKQNAPLSKYEISKETGLSAPTVTHKVNIKITYVSLFNHDYIRFNI